MGIKSHFELIFVFCLFLQNLLVLSLIYSSDKKCLVIIGATASHISHLQPNSHVELFSTLTFYLKAHSLFSFLVNFICLSISSSTENSLFIWRIISFFLLNNFTYPQRRNQFGVFAVIIERWINQNTHKSLSSLRILIRLRRWDGCGMNVWTDLWWQHRTVCYNCTNVTITQLSQ